MSKLPEKVRAAWDDRDGPIILATVDTHGVPNIIYAGSVGIHGDDRLVVTDNYFDKTRKNIMSGSTGSILFRDKAGKAYQVKGTLEYHTEGIIFDKMKVWNPPQHPGHAALALCVGTVFSGAEQLL